MTVAGKVVLITGAARGMGREMTRAFLKEGAQVIATDLSWVPTGVSNDDFDFKAELDGESNALVATLDITLQRDGEAVRVTVDDGDLRNQVVALGLGALFMTMLWPLLLTAGYGWIQKGEIRGAVIAYVAGLLNAQA